MTIKNTDNEHNNKNPPTPPDSPYLFLDEHRGRQRLVNLLFRMQDEQEEVEDCPTQPVHNG